MQAKRKPKMGWFSRKRKAPPATLAPLVDSPRAGAKIELDEVEQIVAETEYQQELKRFNQLASDFNHQVSESTSIQMGYAAQRSAVFEVAKKRNLHGDSVGAINSGLKAWALEEVEAEIRKSQGDNFASQTSFILKEISDSFANAGDVPRAIRFLDDAIEAVKDGNFYFIAESKGLIEVWDERRNELFHLYDNDIAATPNHLAADLKYLAPICQYCSEEYVKQFVVKMKEHGREIFELHEFSAVPRVSLMRLSVLDGADVNRFDKLGTLPIHLSAQTGNVNAISVLIDAGADVNAPSGDRWSSLMLAAEYGHLEATNFLLDAGADCAYVGEGGWTALHRAGAMGLSDVVQRLIEAGAGRDQTDDNGLSPKQLAESRGHLDTANIL